MPRPDPPSKWTKELTSAGGETGERIQHGCRLTCQTCVNRGGFIFSVRGKRRLTKCTGIQRWTEQVHGMKSAVDGY